MARRRSLNKQDNNQPRTLYRKGTEPNFSSYRDDPRYNRRRQSGGRSAGIFNWISRHPKVVRNIFLIVLLILVIFFVVSHLPNGSDDSSVNAPTKTPLGNNSLGYVYKEGPYGNNESNVTIAYILGVHPREKGAHNLFEKAFMEKADSLNCSYYIYRINVTDSPTDYEQSRMNGQQLAKKYVVPDITKNNFTAAIDVHYSNGNWGVERFVFSPNEKNTLSSELGHAISNMFNWMEYYTPPNPTSPQYVTGPLNDGGVAAIIYEAYTEDDNNVTLDHDRQIIDFVDDWAFTKLADHQEKEKGFSLF